MIRRNILPGRWLAVVFLTLPGLFAVAGCERPCVGAAPAVAFAGRQFSGPETAVPIFNPPIVTEESGQRLDLPAIEAFNWRPVWPADAGCRLPEITFYNEYYYDRQSSYGGAGWPFANDGYFSRTFRSSRSGVIVK